MIAVLLAVALLQQVGDPPAALVVREGERVSHVPVVVTRLGPMVRSDDVLASLGGVLLRDGDARYRLVIGGTELELGTGLAVARARGVPEPLAAAPTLVQGQLFLPLSLLTDVIPRVVTGFLYDAARGELRRFAPVTAARAPSADAAPAIRSSGARDARAAPTTRPAAPPERSAARRQSVVVVDAGHGGRDRGMRGPLGSATKVYEADMTLAIARQLRAELTARGVEVVMTRASDTLIALGDRGRIANRAQGDLFISIHVNAANPRWKNPSASRGFETYFLSEARTDDARRVAELENEAVKYEVEDVAAADDPLSFVLNDMKQNEYLRESSDFARVVQQSLKVIHPGTDRGVKQAGFVVLVGAFMPSVLVEVGFGSNPADAAYLSGARGQAQLAAAIADATMTYLAKYGERRTTGGVR
ncbi:MAG: N-acetylmuramoyl-L-alanine amidase [Gemmatimonadetes bacterium]|nr:N-acetylmuramoyl-L-alanine amidase [Gemmatimonadota bacterium]